MIPRPVMRLVVRSLVRPTLSPKVSVATQRRRLDLLARLARLPAGTRVTSVRLGSRAAEKIETGRSDYTRAVLYLHGGGYTVGSMSTHRALAAHLAKATGSPVYVLDYRLAPEHPFPAALEDAVAAYEALLDRGIDPDRLTIVGDSAGGGLGLATALRLRDSSIVLPRALGLISPWVDLTLARLADSDGDPMLTPSWLEACARNYAGQDTGLPLVSPLFADLSGLPPMVVHGSSDEILLPDVERFVDAARAAGVSVDYRRLPRLWHVAHLHAGLVSASTQALHDFGTALISVRAVALQR